MGGGYPVWDLAHFHTQIHSRLVELEGEWGSPLVLPIGLLLVVDEENGGSKTAQELVKRIFLLHAESKNVIDFYYLGWSFDESIRKGRSARGMRFSLREFQRFRAALTRKGIRDFGGNADLILVDAEKTKRDFVLHFERAIRIDLAAAIESARLPSVGAFTQGLIRAAEEIRAEGTGENPVWRISDKLGLASARQSMLETLFEKWGKWIGAGRLQALAVRKLGPPIRGIELAVR